MHSETAALTWWQKRILSWDTEKVPDNDTLIIKQTNPEVV